MSIFITVEKCCIICPFIPKKKKKKKEKEKKAHSFIITTEKKKRKSFIHLSILTLTRKALQKMNRA